MITNKAAPENIRRHFNGTGDLHVAEAADVSLETVLAVMAAIHLVKTIQDQGGTLESAKVKVSESKE